mmetsp:Transcript_51495/g.117091  ORF Transcript_51495/g.117091 Transcript_51495/m.117091 type:complete len:509 (+) Transcript_51495:173-1699(+)
MTIQRKQARRFCTPPSTMRNNSRKPDSAKLQASRLQNDKTRQRHERRLCGAPVAALILQQCEHNRLHQEIGRIVLQRQPLQRIHQCSTGPCKSQAQNVLSTQVLPCARPATRLLQWSLHHGVTTWPKHATSITVLLIIRRSEDHHTTTKQPRTFHGFHDTATLLLRPALLAQLPDMMGPFASPRQTQLGHQIDEHLGWVELARCSHFSSSIVPVKCVVPIVPAFANSRQRDPPILSRHVSRVVRLLTERVDHRVHSPSGIQDARIPQHTSKQKSIPERIPEHRRDIRGHEETQQQIPERIGPLLKHDHGICLQISHAQTLPSCDHLRSLLRQHPTSVREEESTSSIMRISRCVGVQMMHPMVPRPVVDGSLAGHRVAEHQEHTQRQRRLVRLVSPEPVHASRNPQRRNQISQNHKSPRAPLQLLLPSRQRAYSTEKYCHSHCIQSQGMHHRDVHHHGPIHGRDPHVASLQLRRLQSDLGSHNNTLRLAQVLLQLVQIPRSAGLGRHEW